jgi:uncharacterized LabA/DUF88 family protein
VTISDRLRLAVFIDFDNIEIGVKNTLNATFDAGLVLEALKERGDVISKTAYSDWQRASGYSRMLSQHAIRMVQRNLTPGGDKNGADINLALDALEMAFTHPHINAFVIVAGDSDFISLVEKLKQYDKKVFVVGGRQFTSGILQRNCHEFIAYENLLGSSAAPPSGGGHRRTHGRDGRTDRPTIERTPIEQAIPLVTRGLKVLSERELSPQLGLLKTTLLQLDSTFSERNYGAGSFRDFVQKLANLGVVRLTPSKGGWLVGPADGGQIPDGGMHAEEGESTAARAAEQAHGASAPAASRNQTGPPAAPAVTGTPADGVRELRAILASATVRRWPMYLRNVQQVLRDAKPSFDVRAYGFGTLVDLLRAAHRDGAVRVDRDRQGVIRVFQAATQPPPSPGVPASPPSAPTEPLVESSVLAASEDPAPSEQTPGGVSDAADNIGNVAPDSAPAPRAGRRRPAASAGAPHAARRRRPRKSGG